MSTNENGGRAFPRPAFVGQDENQEEVRSLSQEGMSLRDWFAGMALQGIIASNGKMLIEAASNHPEESGKLLQHLAGTCFEIATDMLKAREK